MHSCIWKSRVRRKSLRARLKTAMAHHKQRAADRLLLERTLAGSVKLLIDMLALFHPEAFRRTGIVRKQALKIAHELGIRKTWELEMAVMLSPLGEALLPKQIPGPLPRRPRPDGAGARRARPLTPPRPEISCRTSRTWKRYPNFSTSPRAASTVPVFRRTVRRVKTFR